MYKKGIKRQVKNNFPNFRVCISHSIFCLCFFSISQTKVRQPYPKLVSELKALNYTDKYYSPGIGIDSSTPEHSSQPRLRNPKTAAKIQSDSNANHKDAAAATGGPLLSQAANLSQLFRLQTQSPNAHMGGSYRLMSVVQHYGDVFSGHFVTYRRAARENRNGNGAIPEQWLFTSDTEVRKVSRDTAMSAEAYMLFYERIGEVE